MRLVANLFEYLKEIEDRTIDSRGNQNERIYYRGEPATYASPMVPSIFRNQPIDAEKDTYMRALRHHPEEFANATNIDIISKLQHFRYKTRMLDFTANPLVALFFACGGDSKTENTFQENGNGHVHIYIADVKKDVLQFDSDRALLISVLPRFTTEEQMLLKVIFERAKNEDKEVRNNWIKGKSISQEQRKEFGRYMHQVQIERHGFEEYHINPDHMLKGYFVKPNFSTARIKNQSGLFAIFGLGYTDFKQAFNVVDNKNYFDIEIDKNAFDHILAELDFFCNIGFATLFDDLEATAKAHNKDLYKVWRKSYGQ